MSVYVDSGRTAYRGMFMCHMLADSPRELHAMADRIGVARRCFQADASTPHYDISQSKRVLAVKFGAKEVRLMELVEVIKRLRQKRFLREIARVRP